MSYFNTPPELRDERAADRDDAADHRDDTAHVRDDAAERRDVVAAGRDDDAYDDSDDVVARIGRLCQQMLDRLARIENVVIDPREWPELTPAALAHLDAHTAEQRRLAAVDRLAVTALCDQMHHELRHHLRDRAAAARDRDASARDRHHSADNRQDSGQDRDQSASDRDQTAIEREQDDLPPAIPSTT